MKQLLIILTIGITTLLHAQTYTSGIGFETKVSDDWLIVTQESIKNNPKLVEMNFPKLDKKRIEQINMYAGMRDHEFLLYKKSDSPTFVDTIHIMILSSINTEIDTIYKETCPVLKKTLDNIFQTKSINIHYCKATTIHNQKVMVSKHDGHKKGITSFSYGFNATNFTLNLSLACKNNKCKTLEKEVNNFFKNFKKIPIKPVDYGYDDL